MSLQELIFRSLMPYKLFASHSSQFYFIFNGSNNLLLHQKIGEPGVSSVVESMGRGFSHILFPAALDILSGS
jgi:hypothetical protein